VLAQLRTPRFADQTPTEVYATLLDEGVYLCSIRTMYRILAAYGEVAERRRQRRHPVYQKPELLAEAPNQVSLSRMKTCAAVQRVLGVRRGRHRRDQTVRGTV